MRFEYSNVFPTAPKPDTLNPMMIFDTSREWLVTNGIGGFASSSVVNCNTRRYHALLCAATQPPLGRMVLVNKADETLTVGERSYELGCNQYPGAIHPAGYQFLKSFERDPLPRWIYEVPGARLEKTLWMPHGENRTVARYRLLDGDRCHLTTRPFVTGRDYHGIHRFNTSFNSHFERHDENGATHISLHPYENCPDIVFSHDGEFYESGAWYHSFEYSIEQERGLDFVEDAWCPGAWVWNLTENSDAFFVVATGPSNLEFLRRSDETEIARLKQLESSTQVVVERDLSNDEKRLIRAADQFIVRRKDGLHTILAGYPWFSDWGRDTMIALPGLCLSTGRFEHARSILQAFAQAASQGMIPNRFPDAGETPDYNTVDATLWFFHAVAMYAEKSGDREFVIEHLYPILRECIEWHIKGTRFGIRADESDGTLRCGDASTQLTWMDAKIGDTAFTPRYGKPVEIQALWFNALKNMAQFADWANDDATKKLCGAWSRKLKANFAAQFWNTESNCLFDCVRDGFRDGAIRPNQIFVVSLPHRLLALEQEKAVVAAVQRELLTPVGLRSLSPSDWQYRGVYLGDQWQRDSSYHQGTVWAWPVGAFFSAYLKVNRQSSKAKNQVREWLQPLMSHLDEACIGSISEIFDGDAPHHPRGCCAQAWSVSEPLRVLLDEL